MPDLKPITWTNWNWRRWLTSVMRQPKPKVKRKPQAWIVPITVLSALASVAAAIAAGFSAFAAFQQTEAAYRSQLYSRQVDAVSELTKAGDNLLETQLQAHVFYKLHKNETHLPDKIADSISSALLSWEVAVRMLGQIAPFGLGLDVEGVGDRMTANIRERTFDHVKLLLANTTMDLCLQRQLLLNFGLEESDFQECLRRFPTGQLMGAK
jgi:hypothetical protein